ncbi:hypothetical protein VZT92_021142 [Zoarces viviparus]|uniref:Ig-like domain-containing protein n=1 Tax=Zoarces viviparus TaxID=48416 RepID=A0AAW1EHP0_ZOAVI
MLTRWLTLTALLAASANPDRAAIGPLTVAPTRRVKGHPEVELTLNCGDGKNAGVVQYWHTPFGDLQTPGSHGKPDPVFVQRDRSLTIPNTSSLHSGMYYCLLRHTGGTTLWSYELHVDSEYKRSDAFRFRRDVGSPEEKQAGVSDGQFAGAVAASVLLTFVVGFSAGALTRTPVLRCLGAVTTRLRSPRQQRCQTDTQEHGSEVTMTTLPPTYDNQAFKMEHDDDSADCATGETTTTPPPAKPQRSFRQKRQEAAQDTTAYLEGCDYMKEAGGSHKERNKGCDGEVEGEFYLEDGGSQSETDEDKCSGDVEEKDGRESKEYEGWRQDEEAGEQENRSKEEGEERRVSAEEKGRDQEEVNDREKRSEEDGETDICSEDGETGSSKQEEGGGDRSSSPGPRSRVIRLYQYDEDGRRYGHLPDAEPGPATRLKQRSLSLTRLNAIMAAASAGPLDTRETGSGEERPHFHMEI